MQHGRVVLVRVHYALFALLPYHNARLGRSKIPMWQRLRHVPAVDDCRRCLSSAGVGGPKRTCRQTGFLMQNASYVAAAAV